MLCYVHLFLLVRFTQGIFGNDPSHHIRNVIPATHPATHPCPAKRAAELHDDQGIPLRCLCDLVQLHLGEPTTLETSWGEWGGSFSTSKDRTDLPELYFFFLKMLIFHGDVQLSEGKPFKFFKWGWFMGDRWGYFIVSKHI